MKDESAANSLNHYFVDASGMRLSIYSTRQSGRPVLYCLPGGPGFDSRSLLPGLLSLSQIFDLHFVDPRGSGKSGVPADGDYSLEAVASDVIALIEHESAGRPVGVFGHSFGGLIASNVVAKCPKVRFGIICGTPFDTQFAKDFDQAIMQAKHSEVMASQCRFDRPTASDDDYRDLILGLRSIYFPELPLEKSGELLSSSHYRIEPFRFAADRILPTLDESETLRGLRVPILVVGGTDDPIITPAYLSRYGSLLQRGTLRLVSGAGHFPFATETQRFYEQVSQWWELNQGVIR